MDGTRDHGPECCCRTCLPTPAPNWPPVINIPEDAKVSSFPPFPHGNGFRRVNSNGWGADIPDPWFKSS
jgi:hypothetical protein